MFQIHDRYIDFEDEMQKLFNCYIYIYFGTKSTHFGFFPKCVNMVNINKVLLKNVHYWFGILQTVNYDINM